jgi:hypothetical protein
MTTVTNRSDHQTKDLTLATYLITVGQVPSLVRLKDAGDNDDRHPVAAWVFPGSQTLDELISEFNAEESLVEPKRFHRALTQTRRELFAFLEIGQSDGR